MAKALRLPGLASLKWLVLFSSALTCLLWLLLSNSGAQAIIPNYLGITKQNSDALNWHHQIRFLGYESSTWEQEVVQISEQYALRPELVCDTGTLLNTIDRIKYWLNTTHYMSDTGNMTLNTDTFSKFRYRDLKTGRDFATYIEPLVRHFRHPLAPCHISNVQFGSEQITPRPIQDRDYLLLLNLKEEHSFINQFYPGRKYLFDLGTGLYTTGLKWLVDFYQKRGVFFDEIWGWEVTEHRAQDYWKNVPSIVKPALHFYNIPATDDVGSPENPISVLKRVFRPGDFVVFKLDIDNSALELSIMRQLLDQPKLLEGIAEMMFEMHYDHQDMRHWFQRPPQAWKDVLDLFLTARKAGLRLHYWP